MTDYRFGTKLKSMIAPIYWDNLIRNFKNRTQIIYGGSSSGKSYAIAQRVVLDTIRGRNTLVIRKTSNSMKSSCFNEILSKISDFGLMYLFKISLGDFTITCLDNNKQIIFKGLDDPEKIKSIRPISGVLTDIWIEEATQISYDDFKLLKTRLRGATPFKKRITMSFNPIIKTHWIYKQFFEGFWQDDKQFVQNDTLSILKTTYKDNSFLTQDDIQRLEAETDPYYRNVYLLGNWGMLAGAVFSNYEVKEFDPDSFGVYRFGLDWGFSCLVGDTQVITDKGNKAIKDIEVGDKVLTRDGYSKVTLKQSKGIQEVYAVDFGKKNSIIVTGDHRIYTENGWKKVKDLQEKETVCVKKSNLMEKFIIDIQKVNTQIIFIPTIIKSVQFCIGIFGNIITELFQRGILFTTLTIIHSITIFQILCVFLLVNTPKFIFKKILALFQKKEQKKLEKFTDIPRQTGKKEEKKHSLLHKLEEAYAKSVEKNIKLLTFIKNIVVQNVENVPILGTVKKNISAKYVELCSLLRHIIQEQLVLTSVPIKRQLLTEKKEVFDITVENGEFFANGILVHNCDPFAVVKAALDIPRREIYICEEIYEKDLSNDKAIPLVKALVGSNVVWCDSAEPKSITEFRSKGINARAVKKGAGSIEQGINFIKRFKVYIHPRCVNTLAEFNAYRYKEDRKTGDVLPEVVDKDNHIIDALRYALESDMAMKGTIKDML